MCPWLGLQRLVEFPPTELALSLGRQLLVTPNMKCHCSIAGDILPAQQREIINSRGVGEDMRWGRKGAHMMQYNFLYLCGFLKKGGGAMGEKQD